jgi:hypothetical protein
VPTQALIGLVSGLLLLVAFGLLGALDGFGFAAVLAYWSLYAASLVVLGRPGRDWHLPAVGASVPAGLGQVRLAAARTGSEVRRVGSAMLVRTWSEVRRVGSAVLVRTWSEVRRVASAALVRTRQVLPSAGAARGADREARGRLRMPQFRPVRGRGEVAE